MFKTSALSSLACVVRRLVSFDGDRSVLLNTSRIIFICGVDTHANREKFDVGHRVKNATRIALPACHLRRMFDRMAQWENVCAAAF